MTTNPTLTYVLHYDISDDRLRLFFNHLKEDGLLATAYPHVSRPTAQDFITAHHEKGTMSLCLRDTQAQEDILLCQLTGFLGMTAYAHFSLRKPYHGRLSTCFLTTALDQLFRFQRKSGGYYVDTVLGVVPVTNRLACRYVEQAGFRRVTTVRSACRIAARETYVDGVLYQIDRGDI